MRIARFLPYPEGVGLGSISGPSGDFDEKVLSRFVCGSWDGGRWKLAGWMKLGRGCALLMWRLIREYRDGWGVLWKGVTSSQASMTRCIRSFAILYTSEMDCQSLLKK